nr:MAG TPA: hypothetical protein [Caudoviricetes sp.]
MSMAMWWSLPRMCTPLLRAWLRGEIFQRIRAPTCLYALFCDRI